MDSDSYKANQRTQWSRVAQGWERWWKTLEAGAGPVATRLVELSGVGEGGRLLDLATGIGEPAVTAARRVGPTGHVVALDISPDMLGIARRRAADLGLANIEFRESDVESMELADPAFDAIVSRWGLMFLSDLESFLRRLRNCLVPGGGFATAVWGPPENAPLIAVATGVIKAALDLPPPAAGDEGPLRLANIERLEEALRHAGFAELCVERMRASFEWSSPRAYREFSEEVGGTAAALLARIPRERQPEVRRAIEEAAGVFVVPGGGVRMNNEIICIAGRRGAE